MKLTKHHREALIDELEKAEEQLSTNTDCLNKYYKSDDSIKYWFEVTDFLVMQKIHLIKNSLIENEIDY